MFEQVPCFKFFLDLLMDFLKTSHHAEIARPISCDFWICLKSCSTANQEIWHPCSIFRLNININYLQSTSYLKRKHKALWTLWTHIFSSFIMFQWCFPQLLNIIYCHCNSYQEFCCFYSNLTFCSYLIELTLLLWLYLFWFLDEIRRQFRPLNQVPYGKKLLLQHRLNKSSELLNILNF